MTNEASPTIAELVRQHLDENRDELAKQAVTAAVADMKNTLKWKIESDTNAQLAQFYGEVVGPAVAKHLDENREEITAAVIGSIGESIKLMTVKLGEDVVKRLGDDWKRRELVKVLFGV
jgi:RNA-binding protein YhbY